MPKFTIHASWTVVGTIEVEAKNLNQAIQKAYEAELNKFQNQNYVDDSFNIDCHENEVDGQEISYEVMSEAMDNYDSE